MSTQGSTIFFVVRLPFPWPPSRAELLCRGEANGEVFELVALMDGRFSFTTPTTKPFISQPIDINSDRPRYILVSIAWGPSTPVSLRVSGQELLEYVNGIGRCLLPPPNPVADGISIGDPNAVSACQKWIQNRKSKFSSPKTPNPDRRSKTTDEQAHDLRASIARMTHLRREVLAGHKYLLGTLAGEMRASVYWPKGRDTQRDSNYNPLLLRMASIADLPLPVYSIPITQPPPTSTTLPPPVMNYEPGAVAPRINRVFGTDQIADLQEVLVSTVLTLGPPPEKTITVLKLIAELAHTMGASHYDEDASEFLDVLHNLTSSQGDQVTTLMCQTAGALASLSDWVLSELKTRNLIS